MMNGSTTKRFPFTASQWQELEHQTLIFKYMVSGIPIPSHLLFTVRRSCLKTTLSSRLFPSHVGFDRKIDPEPGRCRRTDGKKWRCSKEAYPDSKYCERHMHRGKNRSRKPVEAAVNQTAIPPPPTATSTSPSLSLLSSHQNNLYSGDHSLQFLSSPHASTPSIGLSSLDNSTPLLSCSLASSDYRNTYGQTEEIDEHAFFSKASGSVRSLSGSSLDDAWQFTSLTMRPPSSSSTTTSSNPRSLSSLNDEFTQNQQNYFLRTDMKWTLPKIIEQEEGEETHKTVHRFFDEWPPKNKDSSWLDLDDRSPNSGSVLATSLSISIPSSSHDFPIFSSTTHRDG